MPHMENYYLDLSDPTISDELTCPPLIVLQRMPQQNELKGPEDDWTGLSSPAERRKAQNRLHQRAWRKSYNTLI
jgi:hypothetical protein